MKDEPQTMTVRVSRKVILEEFVQLDVPFYPGDEHITAEARARVYVEAALEAGQPLEWLPDDSVSKATKDERLIARTVPF